MDPLHEIRDMVPPLNVFARRFYRERYDVEDLVQETLTRAPANLESFTPATRMKSWLFTIMRRTFYNRTRVAERERPGEEDCASLRGCKLGTVQSRLFRARARLAEADLAT